VTDGTLRDDALEVRVATARRAVALGLSLRERQRLGVRRPLPSLTLASRDPAVRAAVRELSADLAAELNVRRIEVAEDDAGLVSLTAKASFPRLGKRLGKRMKAVAAAIEALDAATLRRVLDGESIQVEGEDLTAEDLVLRREALPGRVVESAGDMTAVLDTTVDDELRAEGWAREIINRVQNLRKEANLDVTTRIDLFSDAEMPLAGSFEACRDLIRGETLSGSLQQGDVSTLPYRGSDKIDEYTLRFGFRPREQP
jgi:isoleucyl-tRNA synthetase